MTTVTLEISAGIATITLDGADSRNALDPTAARALLDACDRIESDDAVGAAVLQGANGTFCSGGDRAVLARAGEDPTEDERYDDIGLIYASFHRFGTLGVPTVVAATGAAVGAGTNLLLAADLAVVADDLRLIGGFARAGIHPGGGHFTLVDRRAGRGAAAALGLFDEEVSGARAVELGLAWVAVPASEVESRARAIAGRVAGDPTLARRVVGTLRDELGPPGIPWAAAIAMERAPQLWSLRRRSTRP